MKVIIHTILGLRDAIGAGRVEMEIPDGSTTAHLISSMVETWGDKISPFLFDEGGHIHPYIRIMVNGRQIKVREISETYLKEADEITIIPFAAGG